MTFRMLGIALLPGSMRAVGYEACVSSAGATDANTNLDINLFCLCVLSYYLYIALNFTSDVRRIIC